MHHSLPHHPGHWNTFLYVRPCCPDLTSLSFGHRHPKAVEASKSILFLTVPCRNLLLMSPVHHDYLMTNSFKISDGSLSVWYCLLLTFFNSRLLIKLTKAGRVLHDFWLHSFLFFLLWAKQLFCSAFPDMLYFQTNKKNAPHIVN